MEDNALEYTGTLTQKEEGLRVVAYQDQGGVWTIGYGRTAGVYEGMRCTAAEACAWFNSTMAIVASVVNNLVSVPVTQNQFNALCDFEYNLGEGALEPSTLLKLLNTGNYLSAAGQFTHWDHIRINGHEEVDQGLLNRRMAEQALFMTGVVIS